MSKVISPFAKALIVTPSRPRHATLGAETLIYFERLSDGHILIPPVAYAKTPNGYVRMEANSAKTLEQVSRRFEAQKKREFAAIDEKHAARLQAKMSEIRGRLHNRMANTKSQFERDFIRAALAKLEQGERDIRTRRIEGHLHIEAHEARG